MIEFGRFAALNRKQRGEGKPETFTFLGFTHYCGKRQNGAFTVWRETAKKRMVAKLQEIKMELSYRRHDPIASVGAWLRKVTSGYYQYHAIPGNLHQLAIFRYRLGRLWRRVVAQRSQRGWISRERWNRILTRWLPLARVLHPHPRERFDAKYPRWKPHA